MSQKLADIYNKHRYKVNVKILKCYEKIYIDVLP